MRLFSISKSVAHVSNVEAISSAGMLIDLCDEINTHIIVKGIRNGEDLEYEMIHAKWNKEHNPKIETVFLPSEENFSSVSSTCVREIIEKNEYDRLEGIMAPQAIEILIKYSGEEFDL